MSWTLVYTRQARRDAKKLKAAGLKSNAEELLTLIGEDPWRNPPPYHRLVGDLAGALSRRISYQHRLVYQVVPEEGVVKVLRLWSHYEQWLSAPRSES